MPFTNLPPTEHPHSVGASRSLTDVLTILICRARCHRHPSKRPAPQRLLHDKCQIRMWSRPRTLSGRSPRLLHSHGRHGPDKRIAYMNGGEDMPGRNVPCYGRFKYGDPAHLHSVVCRREVLMLRAATSHLDNCHQFRSFRPDPIWASTAGGIVVFIVREMSGLHFLPPVVCLVDSSRCLSLMENKRSLPSRFVYLGLQ